MELRKVFKCIFFGAFLSYVMLIIIFLEIGYLMQINHDFYYIMTEDRLLITLIFLIVVILPILVLITLVPHLIFEIKDNDKSLKVEKQEEPSIPTSFIIFGKLFFGPILMLGFIMIIFTLIIEPLSVNISLLFLVLAISIISVFIYCGKVLYNYIKT